MQTLNDHPAYEAVKIIKSNNQKTIELFRHIERSIFVVQRTLKAVDKSVYSALCQYTHPNLIDIYDVYEYGNGIIVLEEYFEGITLSTILKDRALKSHEIRQILYAVCDALEALHSIGIIHRDVKPQNILVGENDKYKLIDYDISRKAKGTNNGDTMILGTPGFAAPEQFGIAESNERTDIYAMGVLMNLLLTGAHPSVKLYDGKARKIIKKCTNIENAERYRSVIDLKKAIYLARL